MRNLLIVTFCLTVTGYVGGAVSIRCNYSQGHKDNRKYFCKGDSSLNCKDLIKTGEKNSSVPDGRFSLKDNIGGRFFTVNISKLTQEDDGKYWCGIDIKLFLDTYAEVLLRVEEAPLPTQTPAATPTPPPGATEGGAYSTAPLPHSDSTAAPLPHSDSTTAPPEVQTSAALMTVAVELNITVSTATMTTDSGFLSEAASSLDNSLSTVGYITVGLSVTVLVFGLFLLIFLRQKKKSKNVTAAISSSKRMHTGNTGGAQAEYEEIKDSNQQPHADTAINTIYCTASSPKDSSDSLNYATINFSKSPDSEDQSAITLTKDSTEYSTVSFHRDPPNSDIYSTVSLPKDRPTTDSPCATVN
ncbi:CMRF35-like molecule 8 [Megalops cyprinoides]|uniref:CMRF35-like molecule 8 n=1 Tax=Megalops cyprinoides TaxID=118141 RepID=UPI0018642F8F|nr:CMRF35-like molecule 8 [Megalops cyprinoides]